MGLLKDLKNIFFGASSVTKHAAEKATDFIKEEGGELLESASDLASKSGDILKDKTSGLKDAVLDGGDSFIGKTKEALTDIGDTISENIGDTLSENPLVDKAKDISENVGEVVMEKGGIALEKGKALSEDVGEKVLSVKDDLMEKAGEVKEKMTDKLNETMDKADAWAEAEKLKPKKEFADDTIDASGSLLEGTDDFFSKADKYASGEYEAFSEGKVTIDDSPKALDKPDFKDLDPATGFEDRDGDGNEIIDDAILDEPDS